MFFINLFKFINRDSVIIKCSFYTKERCFMTRMFIKQPRIYIKGTLKRISVQYLYKSLILLNSVIKTESYRLELFHILFSFSITFYRFPMHHKLYFSIHPDWQRHILLHFLLFLQYDYVAYDSLKIYQSFLSHKTHCDQWYYSTNKAYCLFFRKVFFKK